MDAYATHLPVLKLLGANLPIVSVLEFGAGRYSTLEFLNRASFPHLERLVSLESSHQWIAEILKLTDDPRLELYHCSDTRQHVMYRGTIQYDLIFIDDGATDQERLITIRAVSEARHGPVVIHDYEHLPYQEAADFDRRWVYTLVKPWTAVLWNGSHPELDQLFEGASHEL